MNFNRAYISPIEQTPSAPIQLNHKKFGLKAEVKAVVLKRGAGRKSLHALRHGKFDH